MIHKINMYLFPWKKPRKMIQYLKKEFGDKPLIGLEIGVYKGEHIKSIFYNLNIRRMYGIDINNCKYVNKKRFNFILANSNNVHNEFPDSFFDFVYIDGSHDFLSVYYDIIHYFPKVKKGGFIGGHDFSSGYGVPKAVIGCFGLDRVNFVGHDWWVVKK